MEKQMPLQTAACQRGEPCTEKLDVDASADQRPRTRLALHEQTISTTAEASLMEARGIPLSGEMKIALENPLRPEGFIRKRILKSK